MSENIEAPLKVIQETILNGMGSLKTAKYVYLKLSLDTHNLFIEGKIDEYKRAVQFEFDCDFSVERMANARMIQIMDRMRKDMVAKGLDIKTVSARTRLNDSVIRSLLHSGSGSLKNYLMIANTIGYDMTPITWQERFNHDVLEDTSNDNDRPDIEASLIDESVYELLQRYSISDMPAISSLGATLNLQPVDLLANNSRITITGSLKSNDIASNTMYRQLPLVIGFSEKIITQISSIAVTNPNAHILATDRFYITAKQILERMSIKGLAEDSHRYVIIALPYRVMASEDKLVGDVHAITINLDNTLYTTTFEFLNINYIREDGTNDGDTEDEGTGNGSGENDTGVQPDGGDSDTVGGGPDDGTDEPTDNESSPDSSGINEDGESTEPTDEDIEPGSSPGETTGEVHPESGDELTDGGEPAPGETDNDEGDGEVLPNVNRGNETGTDTLPEGGEQRPNPEDNGTMDSTEPSSIGDTESSIGENTHNPEGGSGEDNADGEGENGTGEQETDVSNNPQKESTGMSVPSEREVRGEKSETEPGDNQSVTETTGTN